MSEKQIYRFTNEINEVEISSIGAKIILSRADGEEITAAYENPEAEPKLCAVLVENKLSLKETPFINILGTRTDENYKINVFLPEKLFAKIKVNTTRGGVCAADVKADVFELNTASGDVNVCADCGEIRVKTASGKVTLNSDTPAKLVKITTVSGNVEVNARAQKFSICSVSGKTVYKNASGEGSVSAVSGNIDLDYREWNGELSISAISGNVNVLLPENSGAEVEFDGISGTLKTDLGSEKGNFVTLGKGTRGTFGKENRRRVKIKTASGNVTLGQQ